MYVKKQLNRYEGARDFDKELIKLWVQQKAPHKRRPCWVIARQFQTFVRKPLAQVTAEDVRAFALAHKALGIPPEQAFKRLLAVKSLLTFGYRLGVLPINIPEDQWPKIRRKKRLVKKNLRLSFGLGLGLGLCIFGIAASAPKLFANAQNSSNFKIENWQESMMSAEMRQLYAQTEAALENANVKAFLDTIAWAEGTAGTDGYRTKYTGSKFTDYSTHPERVQCAISNGRQLCSNAAGRYQFLKSTYERIAQKLGLRDFSPRSQDLAAVELIREQDALEDIQKGNIKTAFKKVSPIWAHIEGAGYGQPEYSLEKLEEVYWQERKKYNSRR
ncbi:MAG: glycoside hydrolase family 104 protein [Oscillatoriaceae bacterium SKW80]|nr:glycoside hydrolase family 104 protein [Oscillatoriaceae bacterium SKYG93]MCX8120953.1 glycoside hydrolase family 104 protein [Oscillatoriaceae bacterium SKW80]MDW8452226.1 glycoside hydrolase family 104 protein [Oscillatoriaceae cyanobacterium SKYGB_i_bin93]